jgi:hypothetical protein
MFVFNPTSLSLLISSQPSSIAHIRETNHDR